MSSFLLAARVLKIGCFLLLLLIAGLATLSPLSSIFSSADNSSPWVSTATFPNSEPSYCVSSKGFIFCLDKNQVYYASLSTSGVGAWRNTEPYPADLSGQACATEGGYIYCIGGVGNDGPRSNSSVYYASISTSGVSGWKRTSNYPIDVYASSCAASDGYMYCVGGEETVGTLQTTTVAYAPISSSGVGSWKLTTRYPMAVDEPQCLISAKFLYCFGGYAALGPDFTSAAYYASISVSGAGKWRSLPSYDNVSPDACVSSNMYVYCIGGHYTTNESSTSVVDYLHILPSGGISAWKVTGNYPGAPESFSCVTSRQNVYCLGGNQTISSPKIPVYYAPVISLRN
jgi:hypothetical protein